MKAINCTQCGATITNVSERSLIIHCDYCGARIMLRPEPEPPPKQDSIPAFYPPETTPVPPIKLIFGITAAIVLVPIFIAFIVIANTSKSTPQKAYSAPPAPSPYSTPSSWSVATEAPAKPIPVVNYQPRVSWNGPNDLEHFDDPQVDIASVSHMTSEEVKKTVFKNRVVKLRVVINTEGEIDEVETISGHPILVEAATLSAKRSIFRSRSKPTTRTLTYTFRVLED